MIAGVDFIPLGELPDVPVATNGGGYAESMPEHALAMALAAAKRLILNTKTLNMASSINSYGPACWQAGSATCRTSSPRRTTRDRAETHTTLHYAGQ
jgi:hypothetical protein